MVSLASIKPFLPFLLTFLGPHAVSYYRAVRTAVRTRPPTKPLSAATSRGLNVLFFSICFFFFLSLPVRKGGLDRNVFAATTSRLHIPTDILFARLASLRPGGVLSPTDETLKAKLTTLLSRQLYLRFGPSTLAYCSFCHPEDAASYLLYHLPVNVLLPHLLHLLVLGLATSEPLAGLEASWWRNRCSLGALALAIVDIYMTVNFTPTVDPNMPSPTGMFWTARTIRPLAICIIDTVIALLIYASATNRFVFLPSPTESDPELARRKQEQMLAQANIALQLTQTKVRAFYVARNAAVRDRDLKATDDEYWRAVVAMEGPAGTAGVWDDEEVQAAVARSYGDRTFNAAQVAREAEAFVSNITQGLENSS